MTRTPLRLISFALLSMCCVQAEEPQGLSPIPGISEEKLSALNDAIAPLLKEQLLRTIPIRDLKAICGEPELIAATFSDEKPTGPLMLQGDHGPVAYRNMWIQPITSD